MTTIDQDLKAELVRCRARAASCRIVALLHRYTDRKLYSLYWAVSAQHDLVADDIEYFLTTLPARGTLPLALQTLNKI